MPGIISESDIWRRAANAGIVFHRIHDDCLSRLDRLLGSAIRLAENNRELSRILWDVRLSMLQTLLPISASQLGLKEAIGRVIETNELKSLSAEWKVAVQAAFEQVANPKKGVIDDIFCEAEDIALWNRPWNSAPKGWPEAMPEILEGDYGKGLCVISGLRDLPEKGSTLVLTSPLWRHFPPANAVKLLRPGRWETIHVLGYAVPLENSSFTFTRDVLVPPSVLSGWSADWTIQERTVGDPPKGGDTEHIQAQPLPYPDDEFDPGLIFGVDESDTAEPVPACVVRLSSGGCVAYANEDRIVVLNGKQRSMSVMELESGDLIPVALNQVDRHGLVEAATIRLGLSNVLELKRRIGEWKQVLRV
ncbi:MAG: hypothetical protein LOX97_09230, partial [Sphingomonas sp.]|nr:hypothetical protein [Sphingomonas sp.]